MAGFSYLNFQYLLYSCTNLASVTGLGNLSGVRSMRFMFASCAVVTLDFRGFDSSTLTDLYYTFSGCNKLTTILADASRALSSRWPKRASFSFTGAAIMLCPIPMDDVPFKWTMSH